MSLPLDTKGILANSLIKLSSTKKISKITVLEIIGNCGVGRQTFYNHFSDKYDLINWIYKKKAEEILDIYFAKSSWYESIYQIYLIFEENKLFYINVFNESDYNTFMRFFFEHTRDYYINSIIKRCGKEEMTPALLYTIEFNSYGAVNMHAKWVRRGMKESAEEMAENIVRNMPIDLRKYFIV